MKPARKKLINRIILVLVPLILIAAGVYMRMYGFRWALEELVQSRTNGRYTLTIEKSSANIPKLSFNFKGLTIRRDSADDSGIRSVYIPALEIHFGSALEMMAFRKFNVTSLVIDEPQIEIGIQPKEKGQQKINIGQQMVELYPPIESLMERFTLHSLIIRKADVSLQKNNKLPLKISLIDLVMEEWDIQNLTGRSQLRLNIDHPTLNLGQATLGFSQVEFNFREHHLRFDDFRIGSADSVSGSTVNVSGQSVILEDLDYEDLYKNHRYSLKRAEINNPKIDARLKVRLDKTKRPRDRDLVTRILKQVIGECSIDSTVINNAQLHLVIQKENDSLRLELPDVDFKFHAFRVIEDSSTFQVGGIETNLKNASISPYTGMSLTCNRIFFDRNSDLTFTDVVISNGRTEPLARLGQIRIEAFDAFNFAFYKQFHANRIHIENTDVRILPVKKRVGRNGRAMPVREIDVSNVELRNVNVSYTGIKGNVVASGVSANIGRLKYDSAHGFQYKLNDIGLRDAIVEQIEPSQNIHVTNLWADPHHVTIGTFLVNRDSLEIQGQFVSAESVDNLDKRDFNNWKTITVKSLLINGKIPHKQDTINTTPEPFNIQELTIEKLGADLTDHKFSIAMLGENIAMTGIQQTSSGLFPERIKGQLTKVNLETKQGRQTARHIDVDYPTSIGLDSITFVKDDLTVDLNKLTIQTVALRSKQVSVDQLKAVGLTIIKGNDFKILSDSAFIIPSFEPSFGVSRLEVFHPIIEFGKPSRKIDKKGIDVDGLPDVIILHPGQVTTPNGRKLSFGRTDFDKEKKIIRSDFVTTALEKSDLKIAGITLHESNTQLDSVMIIANSKWRNGELEESIVDTRLYNVLLNGYTIDRILRSERPKTLDVVVGRAEIDVTKDKRKPDGPLIDKPSTLNGLFKVPTRMKISTVQINDGRIHYIETSEKAGEQQLINLEKLKAQISIDTLTSFISMKASTSLFNSGQIDLSYEAIAQDSFKLQVRTTDFDLTKLNPLVNPLLAMKIRSGVVQEYNFTIGANDSLARGPADITYKNLHLKIFKRGEPDKVTLGSEIITLLADRLILKNKKRKAASEINQTRVKHKGPFNFWVRAAVQGAVGGIRHGKNRKRS